MNTKTPHERRQHALQLACIATGIIALVWVGTFSLRASVPSDVAQTANTPNATQLANAESALPPPTQASLEVATTSVFNTQQSQ